MGNALVLLLALLCGGFFLRAIWVFRKEEQWADMADLWLKRRIVRLATRDEVAQYRAQLAALGGISSVLCPRPPGWATFRLNRWSLRRVAGVSDALWAAVTGSTPTPKPQEADQ